MKKNVIGIVLTTIVFSLLLGISNQAEAFVMSCGNSLNENPTLGSDGGHKFIKSDTDIDCWGKDADGNEKSYNLNLKVLGPGIAVSYWEILYLTCPLISYKRLSKVIAKKGSWSAYGIEAKAAASAGVRLGIGLNQRGAFCTVTGLNFGFGAGAGGLKLTLTDW